MHFYVTDYQAEFRVRAPFRWARHPGSRVHYLLKAALERVDREVREKLLAPTVPTPSPHRFLESGQRAPAGLIPIHWATPAARRDLAPGDTLRLRVRRFGRADRDTDRTIVDALDQLDEALVAETIGRQGPRERTVEIDDRPIPTPRVSLSFITPAHIQVDKKVRTDLTFSALIGNLRRRLETICALYGELPPGSSERSLELLKRSGQVHGTRSQLRVETWKRQTSSPSGGRTTHRMTGLLGTLEFAGPLAPFASTLLAAEEMHVGKMTSMGLGRIEVART